MSDGALETSGNLLPLSWLSNTKGAGIETQGTNPHDRWCIFNSGSPLTYS